MKKWEVTFKFKSCTPSVLVLAETEELAIEKARERDYPPVPQYIPATVVQLGRGGPRLGSGNKEGTQRVRIKRTVKKTVLWTPSEWEKIESKAKKSKLTVADYQRMKILGGKRR